jgi:hypothetical protein
MKIGVVFEVVGIADALENLPSADRDLVYNRLDNYTLADLLAADSRISVTMLHVNFLAPWADIELRNWSKLTLTAESLECGEVKVLAIYHDIIDEEEMLAFLAAIDVVLLDIVADDLAINTLARLQLGFDVFLHKDLRVDVFLVPALVGASMQLNIA